MNKRLTTTALAYVILFVCEYAALALPTLLEVGEATGRPITLNKFVKEGDLILLDEGDPKNAKDQANKNKWSDVLRFERINVGTANETVTVRLISDADPADLSDAGFNGITLQANRKFVLEPLPGKPGQPVPLLLYIPMPDEPGYEGGVERQYKVSSDPSEHRVPETGSTAVLLALGLLVGHTVGLRRDRSHIARAGR